MMDRRDFLKASALTTLGTFVGLRRLEPTPPLKQQWTYFPKRFLKKRDLQNRPYILCMRPCWQTSHQGYRVQYLPDIGMVEITKDGIRNKLFLASSQDRALQILNDLMEGKAVRMV